MQWRAHATSIALMLFAAGALLYAYRDRDAVTEGEKKARPGNVFGAWRRDQLARMTIESRAGRVVLERTRDDAGDAEWWLRAPRDEKADAEAADKLAAAFEFATVVRKVDPGARGLGLDAPRAHGEVAMQGLAYRFALGDDAPTPPGSAYLRVDGGEPVVVSRELVLAIVQAGQGDVYRSKTIVPYLSVELARLEIKRAGAEADGGGLVTLERADDVSFTLAPSGLRASRSKLDAVWGALAQARAEGFLSDAEGDRLTAAPRMVITMTPKSGGAVGVLRVGEPCPSRPDDVAVVREGKARVSACAPKGILEGLAARAADLVDARLFAANDDEVSEVRLETLPAGKGTAIDVARKGEAWRELVPEERDLAGEDGEAASALAAAVVRAEGTDPVKAQGPFEVAARATVRRGEGDVTEVVDLSAPDEAAGSVIARRTLDGARLRLSRETARQLRPRAVALRGKSPWTTTKIEGAPVAAVETHCGGVDQRVTKDGDQWTMRAPRGFAVDNTSLLRLLDAVGRARVQAWVADQDDGRFGLGVPPCYVALTLPGDGGDRVARVDFGADGEGGVYALTSDSPAVFVAPKGLRDDAKTWLLDLHGLAPPTVDRVTLARAGKTLSFSSDAGEADAAEGVLGAAEVLRADAALHLGPALAGEGFARPSLVAEIEGGKVARRVVFGAETDGGTTYFARIDGVEATFVVARDRVRAFFEAFGG